MLALGFLVSTRCSRRCDQRDPFLLGFFHHLFFLHFSPFAPICTRFTFLSDTGTSRPPSDAGAAFSQRRPPVIYSLNNQTRWHVVVFLVRAYSVPNLAAPIRTFGQFWPKTM